MKAMKKLHKFSKNKIIKLLSIDSVFNIYTRTYMNYLIKKKSLKYIYILDFNNIGRLNYDIGFDKVNEKFRKILSVTKRKKYNKIYVGRFFSGDEIIIATNKKNISSLLLELKNESKLEGMDFVYISCINDTGIQLEEKLKEIKKFK